MPHDESDGTIWIGYADFLTTLAILFFVLLVLRLIGDTAILSGRVVGQRGAGVEGCTVQGMAAGQSDPAREERTDDEGQFLWEFDDLRDSVLLRVAAYCDTFPPRDTVVALYSGAKILLNFSIVPESLAALPDDPTTTIAVLQGDALFERNEATLSREGIRSIEEVAPNLRDRLRSGGILAVQGHTDSVPFPDGSGMDNWRLSVMRAAAAAKVLREPEYEIEIPECRMVVMGFGSTRPNAAVENSDSPAERMQKNRRIEFRLLRGADLTGLERAGC